SFAALNQRDYVVPRPHPSLVTRRVLVMERLSGFKFDDVVGMQDAGVDTEKVVRTGMIGFMEGAMINGIFHGDLHGGNLIVFLDGAIATLAPDLDLIEEIGQISMHFATTHGDRLAAQLGLDLANFQVDVGAMREGIGIEADASTTYREMQERRDLIMGRLQ